MNYSVRSLININGEICPSDQAKISVFDRGFLFGDSVYEVIRTYSGKLSLWPMHYQRLCSSANKIGMTVPYSENELSAEMLKTINALQTSPNAEFFIRLIITRGCGGFTMDFSDLESCNLVIMVKELPQYPRNWYTDGVKTILASIHRTSQDTIDPSIKSGNYLNNVMAYQEAYKLGAYDAIMLNQQGEVTEATTSNIWIIKDGTIITPPLKAGILGGITRACIINLCKTQNLSFAEETISPQQLFAADECFLSSSTKELIPVIQIDQNIIGEGHPGPLTNKISQLYLNFVKNRP